MGTNIHISEARIEDQSSLASFLSAIPESAQLGALISTREPLNTRAYDDDQQSARFVISDGTTVTCFTIAGITIDQAELITIFCEESNEWNVAAFRQALARAVGEPAEPNEP
jgi:hypothetical protein